MFDDWLEESLGDPGALLQLTADNLEMERRAGCRKLLLAAAFADCHAAPAGLELVAGEPASQSVLVDRYVRVGPVGTPLVAESCPAEWGHALHCGPGAARRWIGAALTIRHRLPRLWARVQAGQVWAWKARQIAEATSELGLLSARIVDRLVTPHLELMAWGRFERVLDATILQVDSKTYQQRAERAAAQRDAKTFTGEHGLRTLVARLEAGDASAFMALVERVAACLAEEGDEDPVGVRRSKAFGIIAHQARLRDLLARHADTPDDPRHPDQRVAAHQADPTDPWAADDLPPAGWEIAEQGNYHQPSFDDPDDLDDYQTSRADDTDAAGWDEEPPVDDADRAWNDQQREPGRTAEDTDDGVDTADSEPVNAGEPAGPGEQGRSDESASPDTGAARGGASAADGDGETDPADAGDGVAQSPGRARVPAAFDRRSVCACGSTFDLRPYSKAELNACRTTAVVHVHVTDRTLIDQHGVLRTEAGPITLDQFRRWLTDADANLSIRPVLDPAEVAPVDGYEIPLVVREAVHVRHPGSIWPYSPATEISTGGRLDLDHTIPYRKDGPPGQTGPETLAPLARSEHRPKTVGGWQTRQPDLGTFVWRSPHGWIAIATNQGTLMLGDSPWAHQVWNAAQPALTG